MSLAVEPVLEHRFGKGCTSFAAPKNVGQPAAASYLRQDCYHLRCTPQYIGPALEELAAAHDTLQIKFNSVTDNPLLKPQSDDGQGFSNGNIQPTAMVHGGNFMASSVGHAAEKMRDVASSLGRLLHEQLVGAIDPSKATACLPTLRLTEPTTLQ